MARLLVGLPALEGAIEKYASRFDMVELRPVDVATPKESTLRKWRKAVAPGFVFSVVLPKAVGALVDGKQAEGALAEALVVAKILEARCVVLQTPPEVRPTQANRKKIAALLERVPSDGVVRCWEPFGMWERDDVVATAKSMGVIPVFDAAREPLPSGPIAYTRLRALGKGGAIGSATVERIAERLRKRRESFVVVEGKSASRVRQALAAAVKEKRERPATGTVVRAAMAHPLIAEDEEQ